MKTNIYITFTVNHLYLDKSYTFKIFLSCLCNTNYFYLIYQYCIYNNYILKSFSIAHQLKKQKIKNTLDYKTLLALAKKKSITLKKTIPINKTNYDLLQLLWVFKDVRVKQLKDISLTNLITHRIKLQKETKIYNAK